MFAEEKRDPSYYKVKPQDASSDDKESCLATRFTVHNASDEDGPNKQTKAEPFVSEGYYSRLSLDDTSQCKDIS